MVVSARAQAAASKVCLHTFSKPLQWLGYDALAESLAQAGFCGIDLSVRAKGHVEPEKVEQDLPRAVEAARKQGIKAGDLVRGASKILGGGGGGKPDFAQGGGADATKINEALEALANQAMKG